MDFRYEPIEFQPGAVAAGAHIAMPSGTPKIGFVAHSEVRRYDHSHVSAVVKGGQVAADSTTFVDLYDGTNAAPAVTVGVSNAGGGADISLPSSKAVDVPVVVAATATVVDESTITLDVATEANDMLLLRVVSPANAPSI